VQLQLRVQRQDAAVMGGPSRNMATMLHPSRPAASCKGCSWFSTVLTAISGRYPDIQSGASLINAAHDSRIDIVFLLHLPATRTPPSSVDMSHMTSLASSNNDNRGRPSCIV
jgi:hypothetical protein